MIYVAALWLWLGDHQVASGPLQKVNSRATLQLSVALTWNRYEDDL